MSFTGAAVFSDDFKSIRTFAERDNSNTVHWSEFEGGGHFASLERPDVVTADLRVFFREGAQVVAGGRGSRFAGHRG